MDEGKDGIVDASLNKIIYSMGDRVWRNVQDIKEENLEEFFKAELARRGAFDTRHLPETLRNRVFKKGGVSLFGLSFTEKLYLLTEILDYNYYIVIHGKNHDGFPVDVLNEALRNKKQKRPLLDTAKLCFDSSLFVLGDKPVISGLEVMRLAHVLRSYKDIIPKNLRTIDPKTDKFDYQKLVKMVYSLLLRYEVAKSRVKNDFAFGMAEFFIMIYLKCNDVCEVKDVAHTYRAVPGGRVDSLARAFSSLKRKRVIDVRSEGRRRVYELTASGQLTLLHIFESIINPMLVK